MATSPRPRHLFPGIPFTDRRRAFTYTCRMIHARNLVSDRRSKRRAYAPIYLYTHVRVSVTRACAQRSESHAAARYDRGESIRIAHCYRQTDRIMLAAARYRDRVIAIPGLLSSCIQRYVLAGLFDTIYRGRGLRKSHDAARK